jgi:rhodanese-related sulfurtransferase
LRRKISQPCQQTKECQEGYLNNVIYHLQQQENSMTAIQTITAEQLKQMGTQDGIILDVRTAMEHDEQCLVCPHDHVPLDTLNPEEFMVRRGKDKSTPVYILCRSGKRATTAAEQFVAAGYQQVFVITGGIIACVAAGQDVKGRLVAGAQADGVKAGCCSLSLERQVRVAAGVLVTVGAFLGMAVSNVFAVIPLAVGCGLIFAGLTDRCGMALLLTKAPWNNPQGSCCKPKCCGGGSQKSGCE